MLDALADTPAEAANPKARSKLLVAIKAQVCSWGLPQEATAQPLGVTQPRLDELMQGRLGKFPLDALVGLARHRCGPRAAESGSREAA